MLHRLHCGCPGLANETAVATNAGNAESTEQSIENAAITVTAMISDTRGYSSNT